MCHQHGLATASLLEQNKVHSLLTNAADLENQNLELGSSLRVADSEGGLLERKARVGSDNQQRCFSRTSARNPR